MYFEQGNIDRYQSMIAALKARFDAQQVKNNELDIVIGNKEAAVIEANRAVSEATTKLAQIRAEYNDLNTRNSLLLSDINGNEIKLGLSFVEIGNNQAKNEGLLREISNNESKIKELEQEEKKYLKRIKEHQDRFDKIEEKLSLDRAEIAEISKDKAKILEERRQLCRDKELFEVQLRDYKEKVENMTNWERMLVKECNQINDIYKELKIDKTINLWEEQV